MGKKQQTNALSQNLIVVAVSFFVAFGVGFLLIGLFKDTLLKMVL